jgi:hypothetical protein
MKKLTLFQENRFGPRKRGSNTIPAKIFRSYPNEFNISSTFNKNDLIINFYRQPDVKIFKNLLFTYSKSKEELVKDGVFFEKTRYLFLKNNNKRFSNGFYYSKYYDMKYYPTYFYRTTIDSQLSIVNYQSKRYDYGIYNRPEYNDEEVLLNYLDTNNICYNNVLVFGKPMNGFSCTTEQKYFFRNVKNYLVNNADNDSVSNTLLEALYYKLKPVLMNNLAIANDNKAMLEAIDYYGCNNFFKKLNNLNNYCWKDLNPNNFKTKSNYIDNIYKRSKTFIEFLYNFNKDD